MEQHSADAAVVVGFGEELELREEVADVALDGALHEVSSFVVQKDGTPKLRSTVSSGGIQPISVNA